MELSVVVGTFNRLEMLRKCLDALIGKTHVEHEIVVVDAGSTDGTFEYLRNLKGIRLVCDGKPIGQAQSLNLVFKTITAKYVCWLSDDDVLQPQGLDLAVAILEQNPDVGMVALKVKDVKGTYTSAPYVGGIWPTGILTCNQGVIRTQVLRSVDYFDETFRDYGIDADLTAKVLLTGYKVVHTKNVVLHHYRDYQSAPGVLKSGERDERMKAAVELYHRKYKHLLQFSLSDRIIHQLNRFMWLGIQFMDRIAGRVGAHLETVFDCNLRDWYNIFHCRYVSRWDLWKNRKRAFYLVQDIKRIHTKSERE